MAFKMALRSDEEGSRSHTKWGTGRDRTSSRWPQMAKPDRSAAKARSGLKRTVLWTASERARDMGKLDEAQGVAGVVALAHNTRHVL